ncbi:unnamed protein product [Paramecium octaurelia]|uniref:Tetratricopeptide repeat protein n=1 Tax=Paramecium octaurelia TaxID=43137 RepID=A0A8S1X818_PAROT|nr:unnamed protein product [Paramecium octaurelia]
MINIDIQQIEEIMQLIQQNKFSEAVEKSKRIIVQTSFNQFHAYNLLKTFLIVKYGSFSSNEKQQWYEQILQLCESKLQKFPSQNQSLFMKAAALFSQNKANESLELCDQIISNNPQQLDGYLLKSKVLSECGLQEQDIEMWRQFVQQFCDVHQGYLSLIIALQNKKKYEEILTVCNKAIKMFPDKQVFLETKGDNLYKLNQYLQAFQVFDELIQKKTACRYHYEMKKKSLRKYKKEVSKKYRANDSNDELNRIYDWINEQLKICYTQLLQETDEECLELERIKFLYEINDVQEARIFLDNMIKKHPENIEAYLFKGIREYIQQLSQKMRKSLMKLQSYSMKRSLNNLKICNYMRIKLDNQKNSKNGLILQNASIRLLKNFLNLSTFSYKNVLWNFIFCQILKHKLK